MQSIAQRNIMVMPKLKIGSPDDKYEQEADQVADEVMRTPESTVAPIQRKCAACEEEEAMQMKPLNSSITPIIQKQQEEEEEELLQPKLTTPNIQCQPLEEEEELQMTPLCRTTTPIIQKEVEEEPTSDEDTNPQVELCGRLLPQTEVEQRNQFYTDFTRELTGINEEVRNIITISLCGFSIRQLMLMQSAGLRLWVDGSLPSIFSGDVERDSRRGSASYARSIRTIFIGSTVSTGYLMHELAHAWDHIRNLPAPRRVRLDDLNERQRRRLMENPGQFLTETNRRQTIRGSDTSINITFSQMRANYLRRLPYPRAGFGLGAEATYARRDPQEFYAEGYAVFHGNSIREQAKVYLYARELYVYLNNEATADSMPVPNNSEVRRASRQIPAARGIR